VNVRQEISDRLKIIMAHKGMAVEEVSAMSGVSSQVIEEYLVADREISFEELKPIVNCMNVKLIWILTCDFRRQYACRIRREESKRESSR